MKSLKAKLFFSVGAILLLVAFLNIVLAEVWINKGLDKKGILITEYVKGIDKKVEQLASFLVTMRLVEKGTGLERVAYIAENQSADDTRSLWKQAEEIVSYDPQIAFVQVSQEKTVTIAPHDAKLYPFSYIETQEGLWVEVEDKLFLAKKVDTSSSGVYLLFSAEEEGIGGSFQSVSMSHSPYKIEDTAAELFKSLLIDEMQWVYKVDMIEALLSYHRDQGIFPIGAVKIGREGEGGCLWAEEVFSNKEYVKNSLKTEVADLFLALRGNDIDVVREVPIHPSRQIYIGFSISDVLRGLASLSGKPVLISASGIHKGFYPNGSIFDYEVEGYTWEKGASTYVQKGDKQYVPFVIDFSLFKVSLLTPKEEATAVVTFLQQLGQEMVVNVGLSLIAAAFISFFIALILLRNISVKITKPITMLSNAAEHLGDGRYADITLPNVEHRQDEVAKLTHSFAGMVGALQDRDKIRGVLHKVVSKEISEEILKRNIDFTGEEKVLTMLFSDIRNFTKMSEGFSPRALITMLNVYLTRMCRIIDATHGVVDKFVGDEIMTLYGAPLPLEGHAILAIQAALAMIQDLIAWNKQREAEGLPTFSIGIGIHTGLVYTGNMGAENRLNYTAIGANVNLASRVCSVAEPMQILVTEETMRAPGVLEKFHFRALEPKMLKGIEDPVILYEVSV